MDALRSLITAFPIPTLIVIAGVVFVGSRMRADGMVKSVRHVAIAAGCYLFAFVVLGWADDSATSLWLLVAVLVVVAGGALVLIVQSSTRRRVAASRMRDTVPPG
jgi:hypothetical protein